jgi:hypothetical protein
MVNALSNGFQTTILNPPGDPNDEIRPTVFWLPPRATELNLGFGSRSEMLQLITTWTYEGIRMHEGRRRAYCRVSGYIRANPRSNFFGSNLEGHAHFDLEGGYVAESSVKITTELEDQEGKYGALILDFDLTRQPGNVDSIVPSKEMITPTTPKGPVAIGNLKKLLSLGTKFEPTDPKLPADVMEKIALPADAKTAPWPYKAYRLKLEKGKIYIFDMIRTENVEKFDPYLILQDKNMKLLGQDDDSAGDLNARIGFLCPETDTYRLIATCLPPHEAAGFRIDIYSTDGKATATLEPEP